MGEVPRSVSETSSLCVECQKLGLYVPAKIVDHIIPINGGDDVLFWPEWNHQPLCQTHHNQKTTQQDPITKANRKAGSTRAGRAGSTRNNWMYEETMNEKDVVNLYQSLARCRDGFMQTRTRRNERQPVKRMSEREREVMECFRNR
jgi:hypothetical protein